MVGISKFLALSTGWLKRDELFENQPPTVSHGLSSVKTLFCSHITAFFDNCYKYIFGLKRKFGNFVRVYAEVGNRERGKCVKYRGRGEN